MRQSKPIAAARAKRRVSEYRRQDAPWAWKAMAVRQLRAG